MVMSTSSSSGRSYRRVVTGLNGLGWFWLRIYSLGIQALGCVINFGCPKAPSSIHWAIKFISSELKLGLFYSGIYYLGVSYNGKQKAKSLGTKDKLVAKQLKPTVEKAIILELMGIRPECPKLSFP